MFNVKEPIPRGLRAGVVYKFLCAGLSTCHVGKMTRHFSTRVREQKEPLLSGSRYFRSGKKKVCNSKWSQTRRARITVFNLKFIRFSISVMHIPAMQRNRMSKQ